MARVLGGKGPIGRYFLPVHLFWLLVIVTSFGVNYFYLDHEVEDIVLSQARVVFQRDKTLRLWLSQLGGIYAHATAETPPNPDLAQIHDRDLRLEDGSILTLINPAYMMRLIYEYGQDLYSPQVRMVSDKPLRPENIADKWELAALVQAEQGMGEIYELISLQGEPYFRYLRPAYIRRPCLNCHAEQGYRVGDLRGGLSVSLPVKNLLDRHKKSLSTLAFWHLLIYLFVASLLFWAQGFVGRRQRERDRARLELAASEEKFRTVADFAFAWEYWLAPDGTFKHISPSVEKITGYPVERFLEDPEFIKTIILENDPENLLGHDWQEQQHEGREIDFRLRAANGEIRWLRHISRSVYGEDGSYQGQRASNYDITGEVYAKHQLQQTVSELREALNNVKLLSGFLPICANCKKIRDDRGYWNQIEAYISEHSDAVFSHGICPDCRNELYPGVRGTDED